MAKEIKAKLTLEDAASSTLNRIKSGFGELVSSEKQANAGMSALKQTFSTMAGVYLPQLTRETIAWGKSFATAASGDQSDENAMSALISAIQDVPWEEAQDRAAAYGNELDSLAIRTGVATDTVNAGFTKLLEIHGATAEGVARSRGEIDQLATISSKLNIPLEAATQEIAFMGEGVLKAKGRMAQLLQATGVFGPSIKKTAEGWAKLTDEQRMNILSAGLEKASSTMEGMPRTFDSLLGSLDNIYELSKEKIGQPLVDALQPQLENLVGWLDKNRDAVERFAQAMAKDVAEGAADAAKYAKEGWQFLVENKDDIKNGIIEAFDYAKTIVSFILDHKEALAYAFGAKTLGPAALALLKPGAAALGGVYKAGAAGIGADGVGAARLAGAAGGVAALGAFTLALGGAALAVDQFSKLMNETGGGKSDERLSFEAIQRRMQEMIDSPDQGVWDKGALEHFDSMRSRLTSLAEEIGENSRAAGALADAAFEAHRHVRDVVQPMDDAARALAAMSQSGVDAASQDANVAVLANGFQAAMAAGNTGTQQYIASLLAKSEALQLAFLQSSAMTAEGFDGLAEMVAGQAKGFADKLKQKADFAPGSAAKPDVPKIAFNGGQSFKIQQDFRDEDPDRIAIVFQKGILESAERRLQASTSTPFG